MSDNFLCHRDVHRDIVCRARDEQREQVVKRFEHLLMSVPAENLQRALADEINAIRADGFSRQQVNDAGGEWQRIEDAEAMSAHVDTLRTLAGDDAENQAMVERLISYRRRQKACGHRDGSLLLCRDLEQCQSCGFTAKPSMYRTLIRWPEPAPEPSEALGSALVEWSLPVEEPSP